MHLSKLCPWGTNRNGSSHTVTASCKSFKLGTVKHSRRNCIFFMYSFVQCIQLGGPADFNFKAKYFFHFVFCGSRVTGQKTDLTVFKYLITLLYEALWTYTARNCRFPRNLLFEMLICLNNSKSKFEPGTSATFYDCLHKINFPPKKFWKVNSGAKLGS